MPCLVGTKHIKHKAICASETTRFFFCTQILPAASAAGEFKKHRKEPNMANKENATPGIGESVDSGVMHNPSRRGRTHARVVKTYGDS